MRLSKKDLLRIEAALSAVANQVADVDTAEAAALVELRDRVNEYRHDSEEL